ncbi:hypothetical protein [Hymenobacter defluvii]|uniref:Uncharacterized protein n=1 Tax=Hymenobacter defluvii TaxID=2054411 RepID=A0ABS3TH31_9BACT|nr:hypothetical protein [Hymenobacter defluvii]MBO3272025.1 hypothetical protein [Hymenobacter defluvii]
MAKAFDNAGLVPSAALQAFQRDYAGLVLYAGLTPIYFSLVHAKVHHRWLRPPVTRYEPDYWEPDADTPVRHFRCAATDYQADFTLDENGGYYEGFQRQASSFDGIVEDCAVWAEVWAAGYRQQWVHMLEEVEHMLPTAMLCEVLQVAAYPAFPEDLIFWGRNETWLIRQSPDSITLFAREPFDPSLVSHYQHLLHLDPKPRSRKG